MANPAICDAPCLRCGQVGTWRRNRAGKPYRWCKCGAVMTLGGADPFPDPFRLPDGIGDAPAPEPQLPAPVITEQATTPEPESDDGPDPEPEPEPQPEPKRKPRGWGLFD
jgi:hypothetical protein